jgi:hypothetical protein
MREGLWFKREQDFPSGSDSWAMVQERQALGDRGFDGDMLSFDDWVNVGEKLMARGMRRIASATWGSA